MRKEKKNPIEICDGHISHISIFFSICRPIVVSPYAAWLTTRTDTGTVVCPTNDGGVVVADVSGTVHHYEVGSAKLRHSLAEWQQMLGDSDNRRLQVSRRNFTIFIFVCSGISSA